MRFEIIYSYSTHSSDQKGRYVSNVEKTSALLVLALKYSAKLNGFPECSLSSDSDFIKSDNHKKNRSIPPEPEFPPTRLG
jgi:hypothetical protein